MFEVGEENPFLICGYEDRDMRSFKSRASVTEFREMHGSLNHHHYRNHGHIYHRKV